MNDLEFFEFKYSLEAFLNGKDDLPHGVKAIVLTQLAAKETEMAATAIRIQGAEREKKYADESESK